MIYIIDDNRHNQMSHNYRIDYVKEIDKYPGQVKWLLNINNDEVQLISKKASCVLIHDSIEEKESKEKLLGICKEKSIPYCIFSNGLTATVFEGGSISSIKKDRFYCNLLQFVQKFVKDREIQLNILALGINYDFERAAILRERLIELLVMQRHSFDYNTAFSSGSQGYKDLHELHYLANTNVDFSEFEDQYSSSKVTADTLRRGIITLSKSVKRTNEK